MTSETKTCQNCKQDFVIEPEDFTFYERIKVPPPTFCPDCRSTRRMAWRNERSWYRRTCDATGKSILSTFHPESGFKVYEQNYWKSDAWDPLGYGKDIDMTRPFLSQFQDLLKVVPQPNLVQKNLVNSEYSNVALNLKNCYQCVGIDGGEDSAYCFSGILDVKNSFDIYQSTGSEQSYELIDCSRSSKVCFAEVCEGCVSSRLLYDCRNCTDCIACVGLRNKQRCIFNQEYAKEQYERELAKFDFGSYQKLQAARVEFEELKLRIPHKFAAIVKSENAVGDNIRNSRDVRGFDIRDNTEHVRYSYRVHHNCSDIWDAMVAWNGAEQEYEVMSCSGQRIVCSALIWGGFDIQYSYNCFDCNNLFACIGLKNKQYCILNKQYTKEEYEKLVHQIARHMNDMPYVDQKGRVYGYGEFFPPELSPFAYNETIAQEYFPLTKEQAEIRGFKWRDPEEKNYDIQVSSGQLPDYIKDVTDDIVGRVIECAHKGNCNDQCTKAFKIIPEELSFYRRMTLPLPRLCPNCRHYERVRRRNPLKLWHRKCQCRGEKSENGVYKNTTQHFHKDDHCPNEFETSYSPERKEIVYCEQCYNSEVV